jgi:RNA polymerase sigma factor (sigma-70 family)
LAEARWCGGRGPGASSGIGRATGRAFAERGARVGAKEEPEDLLALSGLVAALPELEREVILLRFFQDLDQYEIAARVGCSQMHISRLQRRALARMGAQLVES